MLLTETKNRFLAETVLIILINELILFQCIRPIAAH